MNERRRSGTMKTLNFPVPRGFPRWTLWIALSFTAGWCGEVVMASDAASSPSATMTTQGEGGDSPPAAKSRHFQPYVLGSKALGELSLSVFRQASHFEENAYQDAWLKYYKSGEGDYPILERYRLLWGQTLDGSTFVPRYWESLGAPYRVGALPSETTERIHLLICDLIAIAEEPGFAYPSPFHVEELKVRGWLEGEYVDLWIPLFEARGASEGKPPSEFRMTDRTREYRRLFGELYGVLEKAAESIETRQTLESSDEIYPIPLEWDVDGEAVSDP